MSTVGVIANPSSGKDIRRLVAHGSVVDNNEKVYIVRRALVGLAAVGVSRVLYMPDYFSIVPRALEGSHLSLQAVALPFAMEASQADSTRAAALLAEAEVGCIITLGGDGTNRAVAKGCGGAPLVPISTGTNNVFPSMIEGTLAGLAAGLVATGAVEREEATRPTKRLEVWVDGRYADLALVDVAFSRERYVGSRAIWEPRAIRELVLAVAEPGSIGLSAIGAHLRPVGRDEPEGLHLRLADGVERESSGYRVLAPIAPGLVAPVDISSHEVLRVGRNVELARAYGTLAFDGERELVVTPAQSVAVRLMMDGPRVVDVRATLELAARRGRFVGAMG